MCSERVLKCAFYACECVWIEIQGGGQTLWWGKISRGEINSWHLYFPPSILKSVYLQPRVQSSLNLSITVLCMHPLILPLELIFLLLLSFSHPIHSVISFILCLESGICPLYTCSQHCTMLCSWKSNLWNSIDTMCDKERGENR